MEIIVYINKAELVECWRKSSKATIEKPVDIAYCYGDWWLDEAEAKDTYGKNSKQIAVKIKVE